MEVKPVKMKSKLVKRGNSWGFQVPKGLLNAAILEPNKEYEIEVTMGSLFTLDRFSPPLTV